MGVEINRRPSGLQVAPRVPQQLGAVAHVLDDVGDDHVVEVTARGKLERLLQVALEVVLQLDLQLLRRSCIDARHPHRARSARGRASIPWEQPRSSTRLPRRMQPTICMCEPVELCLKVYWTPRSTR